jgi:regulatory protein
MLYRQDIRRFSIEIGTELSENDYRTLLQDVLMKRAKHRVLHLLESRDYTQKELREKMKSAYPSEIVEAAIDYAASYNYVDDDRYCTRYIECYRHKHARTWINRRLLEKGISKDCIEEQWERIEPDGSSQREDAQIETLLQKHHYDPDMADEKQRRRLFAMLARRGYEISQIVEALRI